MKTFRLEYVIDRSKDWRKESFKISQNLRSRGYYPNLLERQARGTIIFSGNIACDCGSKFDKCYCDGDCN